MFFKIYIFEIAVIYPSPLFKEEWSKFSDCIGSFNLYSMLIFSAFVACWNICLTTRCSYLVRPALPRSPSQDTDNGTYLSTLYGCLSVNVTSLQLGNYTSTHALRAEVRQTSLVSILEQTSLVENSLIEWLINRDD